MNGPPAHSKRLAAVFVLALAFAGILLTSASGASFDDTGPCPTLGPVFTCPTAEVGKPYSVQLKGKGGCDLYWFEVVNSSLPAGLSMNTSGVISGVPTAAGRSDFYVHIHDLLPSQGGYEWCGFDNPSQKQFAINVDAGLAILNQSVKGGTIGQPYTESLKAQRVVSTNPLNGTDVQATWSLQSGSLPPGVNLTAAGVLEGTPTTEGTFQFVVKAENGAQSDTETYTIPVRQPVVITSPFGGLTSPKSEVGVPFEATLTAAGGTGLFAWAVAGGAPPTGVEFVTPAVTDPAAPTDTTTATLSGTPEVAGRFPLRITVTDSEGRMTTLDATFVVAAELGIKTALLRPAKLGRLYQAKVKTIGGVQPVRWRVLRGTLPRGVRFAKQLGMFVGTPRRVGRFRVTVQASDALGVKTQKLFVIVVRA